MSHLCLSVLLIASILPAEDQDPVALRKAFSEAHGVKMSQFIREQGLDVQAVIEGIRKGLLNEAKPLPADEMKALYEQFSKLRPQLEKQEIAKAGAEWKAKAGLPEAVGPAFYQAFCSRQGVTVTKSGLAYEVLKAAEGPRRSPGPNDRVRVHYIGRLTDGAIFDSTQAQKEPLLVHLDRAMPGWREGAQLMTVGSTWRFVIPAHLAFGEKPKDPGHPPGILLFDVTLVGIETATKDAAQ